MQNSVRKSLSFQITHLLEVKAHTKEFDMVFLSCLEHICLETKIKEFHNNLRKYVDFSKLDITPSSFRLALAKSGYLLLNVKFYCVYMALHKKATPEVFEYYSHQHEVEGADSQLIELLFTEKFNNSNLRRMLRKAIPSKNREFYSAESIEETISEFGLMLPDLKRHIDRTIYLRLRFLKRPFNITNDEFVSELLFSAIRAHYRSKPNANGYEKQLNKLRASIHNASINLIKGYTTGKRQRLENMGKDAQGNNVFSLITVSENQMSLANLSDSDVEVEYDSMFSSSLRLEMEKNAEDEYSIQQLITKYGPRSRQTRLLRAFFYKDCYMLRAWLTKRKLLRSQTKTTRDFLDTKTRAETLNILSEYLSVSHASLVNKSLPSLARAMGVI